MEATQQNHSVQPPIYCAVGIPTRTFERAVLLAPSCWRQPRIPRNLPLPYGFMKPKIMRKMTAHLARSKQKIVLSVDDIHVASGSWLA